MTMAEHRIRKVAVADAAPNRRRGGDLRVMLSPVAVGATSGFMGIGTFAPGERVIAHRHPYSEEFIIVTGGQVTVEVDGEKLDLVAGEGVMVPKDAIHRLANTSHATATIVFHLSPLAPRPELGHVDLEPLIVDEPAPRVG
jgi:putative monooxygenase